MEASTDNRREALEALHRKINKIQTRREKLIEADAPKRKVEQLDDRLTQAYEMLEQETQKPAPKPKRRIEGGKYLPPADEEIKPIEEQFVREALDGVKRIMEAEGITQYELAGLLGIHQSSVSTAINIDNKSSRWRGLRLTTIARLYDVLGYNVHINVTRKDKEDEVKWHNQ